MLKHIYIQNFTIIDRLELELNDNLTVLTGETGAGKSILIDALQIALGEKADAGLIRNNCERCEITAIFDIHHNLPAKNWLKENELDDGDECIIARIINRDGRSRCLINGRPSPVGLVQKLGALFVHIHGQNQHQALLKNDYQRQVLDAYAKHPLLSDAVLKISRAYKDVQNKLSQLKNQDNLQSKIELLQFQLNELEKLALKENELLALECEHKKLAHAEQILQHCQTTLTIFNDDETSILHGLHQTLSQINAVIAIDQKIAPAAELIRNAIIQIEEASNEISDYATAMDINPERLQWIDSRLAAIFEIARKHQITPDQLPQLQKKLQTQLENIMDADRQTEKLQEELAQLYEHYSTAANVLHDSRTLAANKLNDAITKQIQKLGMPHAQFHTELVQLDGIHPHGSERIEFLVRTNPGQPFASLQKVASGGELSRIALAIQVIAAQKNTAPTLIFDEVDVGIGGATAQIIGQLLKKLGHSAQVLCITHLPQVAAQGTHHLHVQKQISKEATKTQICTLGHEEKITEIARMLGGLKITERTLDHAREMLEPI